MESAGKRCFEPQPRRCDSGTPHPQLNVGPVGIAVTWGDAPTLARGAGGNVAARRRAKELLTLWRADLMNYFAGSCSLFLDVSTLCRAVRELNTTYLHGHRSVRGGVFACFERISSLNVLTFPFLDPAGL